VKENTKKEVKRNPKKIEEEVEYVSNFGFKKKVVEPMKKIEEEEINVPPKKTTPKIRKEKIEVETEEVNFPPKKTTPKKEEIVEEINVPPKKTQIKNELQDEPPKKVIEKEEKVEEESILPKKRWDTSSYLEGKTKSNTTETQTKNKEEEMKGFKCENEKYQPIIDVITEKFNQIYFSDKEVTSVVSSKKRMISNGIAGLFGLVNQNSLQENIANEILNYVSLIQGNDLESSEKIIKDLTNNNWEDVKSFIKGLKFLNQVLGDK
jgi:hypothetical protein